MQSLSPRCCSLFLVEGAAPSRVLCSVHGGGQCKKDLTQAVENMSLEV